MIETAIIDRFSRPASENRISSIYLGLGYCAVCLEDGSVGVAATLLSPVSGCRVWKDPVQYEGRSAKVLLDVLADTDRERLSRSVAIALVGALNQKMAGTLLPDALSAAEHLGVDKNSKVAMIGSIEPIARELSTQGVQIRQYDIGKGVGEQREFYSWCSTKADALVLTATSIILGGFDMIWQQIGRPLPTMLVGPSTILSPEIYRTYPVRHCCGIHITDGQEVLKAVRQGRGTKAILSGARKVYSVCPEGV